MNCPKCGRETSVVEGQEYCAYCGEKFLPDVNHMPSVENLLGQTSKESVFSPAETLEDQQEKCGSPWEDENSTGFFQGLILTVKETMFNPAGYFKAMSRSGSWLIPVLFYVIMGVIGAVLGMVSGFLVESPVMTHGTLVRQLSISSMLVLPFLLFVELYFGSLMLHLGMIIFGARKENFVTTLKIVAYSSGPNIFYAVPFVGWLIAALWSFWITLVGIKEIGKVSLGRALLVTLAPAFLVFSILVGLFFLVVGMIGVSGFF